MSLDDSRAWTEERTALLMKLHAEGLPFSAISAQIPGTTRNSVISRSNRIGLTKRGAQRAKTERKDPPSQRKKLGHFMMRVNAGEPMRKEALALVVTEEPAPATRCSLLDLSNVTCRFPIDVPGESGFFFCGDPSADMDAGRPYCGFHAGKCFLVPRRWS